jgi:predicted DNA-binding WGR domain protein
MAWWFRKGTIEFIGPAEKVGAILAELHAKQGPLASALDSEEMEDIAMFVCADVEPDEYEVNQHCGFISYNNEQGSMGFVPEKAFAPAIHACGNNITWRISDEMDHIGTGDQRVSRGIVIKNRRIVYLGEQWYDFDDYWACFADEYDEYDNPDDYLDDKKARKRLQKEMQASIRELDEMVDNGPDMIEPYYCRRFWNPESNHFWHITLTGASYRLNYGNGSGDEWAPNGKNYEKTFATVDKCSQAARRAIATKLKTGYIEKPIPGLAPSPLTREYKERAMAIVFDFANATTDTAI